MSGFGAGLARRLTSTGLVLKLFGSLTPLDSAVQRRFDLSRARGRVQMLGLRYNRGWFFAVFCHVD
jgi:hypothetical protein